MFITRKSLPRRTFVRGIGATLALPLLESMVPAFTASARTAAAAPLRFAAVYVPNGVIMPQWTPATAGAGFTFTPTLKPLEPFRDRTVVVSNLTRPGGADTSSHAPTAAGWLSGARARATEAQDVRVGTTIDQIVARQIGQDTPFPSLELATENFTGFVGACSTGYSCAYMNTLSWASPTQPLPMELDPRAVFERLFGRAGTAAQRLARRQEDRSILDSVTEQVTGLTRTLGPADRSRMNDYLEAVREIERRIQQTETRNRTNVMLDAPAGVPDSYAEYVQVMFDLMVVAYQTDLTRVATFMMARESSNLTYPEIGVTNGHHEVSHHGNKPDVVAAHAKVNLFHVQQFARFVDKLAATRDGDGTLLDHILIVYGSGMSDGNVHSPDPLPTLVVGGVAGRGHRHVMAAPKTPLGNLWVATAERFGGSLDTFGESTGRLDLF
jgi:hypothetical protein